MLKYEHVNVAVSRTNILNDINITFPKGQITTIIGPNGCGKTTLLQCLNGCSKVTAGTITVDNENILSLPLKERAKRIAFLPQIRTVIPVLPVRTLVEHGRFPYLGFTRRKTDKDNEIVNNSMEFTNVMPYSEDNADTLSGGIRQRVFFSMILAQDSRIIIMDEPVTYLDLEGKRTFFSMVNKLKKFFPPTPYNKVNKSDIPTPQPNKLRTACRSCFRSQAPIYRPAIHNIGKKGKKLHQQSIHCENSIALTCTGRSEKSSDGD